MTAQGEAPVRSFEDQLMIDLQAFLFAADARLRFSELKASFPSVSAFQLIDALAELEAQTIISFSVQHNAIFEKAKRTTQSLKPLP